MKVVINGQGVELGERASLADAVEAAGADPDARGVAAAVGGEVVSKGLWRERELSDGENVEVVHAVQGG